MQDWRLLALPLIAEFEGCARKGKDGLIYPYLDKIAKPNVWTRGYGRTYGITETSKGITMGEALEELGVGIEMYALEVINLSPYLVLRPLCMAAIVSWTWNCGVGAYRRSRLKRAINSERWEDGAEFIKKPNTAGGIVVRGLTIRRTLESKLFREGI